MYNDPRLKNEYHAWFLVRGFESHPDKITKQLGIEPTKTRIKGEFRFIDKNKLHKMLNKDNQWILDSDPELPRNIPIEKHLEYLLNKIKPYKHNFINISNKYSLELTCAIYYYEANPGINLENKILKEIAELNTELGLDIYCLAGTVLQLEESKMVDGLVKELNEVKFISGIDKGKHNMEIRALVNNLKELEDVCYNLVGFHLPDLFSPASFNRAEFKIRFEKIGEDLKRIVEIIKRSKYLNRLANKKLD